MASGITLTASVRRNLLALQAGAALTAGAQGRLSTGKKVSSALDNPTSFFTARGLSARAADLGSLLDGMSEGIQAIQAANQGITAIQKLVDTARSLAAQALASKDTRTDGVAGSDFDPGLAGGPIIGHPIIIVQPVQAYDPAQDQAQTQSQAQPARIHRGGTTVGFTVDGAARTVALSYDDTVDTAVDKLNAAAGGGLFGVEDGRVAVHGAGTVAFDDDDGAAVLGFGPGDLVVADRTRAGLAAQFNALRGQIDQLARDASYGGLDLIGSRADGNRLHVAFNERDTAGLDVQGVDLTAAGLGLAAAQGFQADSEVGAALTALTAASGALRAAASTFGSNLSVVQNRQNFSRRIIAVLGAGGAALTDADLNAASAESQALATRRSLGVSALSLSNRSQRGILQLLR